MFDPRRAPVAPVFALLLLLAADAFGQGPPGDVPVNAVLQAGPGIAPVNTASFLFPGPTPTCGTISDPHDGWWYYVATATGVVTVSVCPASTAAPGGFVPGDNVLAIYADVGAPGPELCCSDLSPQCGFVEAERCCAVVAGSGYYVQLANWGASAPMVGHIAFVESLTCGCPPPPNDECAGAIPVFDGCSGPYSNACATTSLPAFGCAPTGNDVWFAFTPTQGCTAFISTCGASFDTVLEVFDACGGTPLVCNDDAPKKTWPSCWGSLDSYVELPIVLGNVYLIRVGGFNGATGTFPLNIRTEFTFVLEEVATDLIQGRLHNGCPNETALIVYHQEPNPPTYDISGECPHVGAGWFFGIQANLWGEVWPAFVLYSGQATPWFAQLDGCGAGVVGPAPWFGPDLIDAVAFCLYSNGLTCGLPSPPIRYL
jgi:hypothetical protein